MALDEARIKEIKGLIAAAKMQPVHFGLCLGAKPETDTLLMHRNKAAKALSMEARTEAKGTKVAFGSANVVGSTLNLTCEEKPPTGLAKRTKLLLKTMKLNMKVKLVGGDGEVFEEDGEEDEEARGAPGGEAAEDPSKAEWAAMRARLETDVMAFLSAGTGDVSRVRASWSMATEAADQDDFAGAVKVGTRLRQLLEGATAPAQSTAGAPPPAPPPPAPPPPAPPPTAAKTPPDAGALARLLAALAPRIPAAAGEDAERRAALLKLATQANVYLKTNNLNYASDTIEQLRTEIEGGSPAAQAAPPPPADAAGLSKQLAALIPRIAGVTDPTQKAELAKLAAQANALLKGGNLPEVATRVEDLTKGLALAASGSAAPLGKEALEKYARAWLATRQAIEDQMEELRVTIGMAYEGQPIATDIDKSFRQRTAPILRTLDASLAVKLAGAAKAEAEARTKLVGEAGAVLATYRSFAADALFADLDDNPFVPLTLRKTLDETFAGMAGVAG